MARGSAKSYLQPGHPASLDHVTSQDATDKRGAAPRSVVLDHGLSDPSVTPGSFHSAHRLRILAPLGLLAFGVAGCGPGAPPFDATVPLTDGVFVGESAPDEQGAYGRSTVTVSDGRISASRYVTVQANGSIKAEDYGKDSSGQVANRSAYRAAQKAVAAFDVYARELIEAGVPADVDKVSGATIAYGQFLEAATAALVASQQGQPSVD